MTIHKIQGNTVESFIKTWEYEYTSWQFSSFSTLTYFTHARRTSDQFQADSDLRPPYGTTEVVNTLRWSSVNWVIIGSHDGLAPNRCQAITWTCWINDYWYCHLDWENKLQWNFKQTSKETHLEMSSANCPPFCLNLNELMICMAFHSPSVHGSDALCIIYILTLYMLNYSEGTKTYTCIYILCHSSILTWHR